MLFKLESTQHLRSVSPHFLTPLEARGPALVCLCGAHNQCFLSTCDMPVVEEAIKVQKSHSTLTTKYLVGTTYVLVLQMRKLRLKRVTSPGRSETFEGKWISNRCCAKEKTALLSITLCFYASHAGERLPVALGGPLLPSIRMIQNTRQSPRLQKAQALDLSHKRTNKSC